MMTNLSEMNRLVASLHSLQSFSFFFLFFFNLYSHVFVLFLISKLIPVFCCCLNSFFLDLTLHYFFHNYDNYSILRDVPECSGMFRNVPYYRFYLYFSTFVEISRDQVSQTRRNTHTHTRAHTLYQSPASYTSYMAFWKSGTGRKIR